jgi:hypothetical protein
MTKTDDHYGYFRDSVEGGMSDYKLIRPKTTFRLCPEDVEPPSAGAITRIPLYCGINTTRLWYKQQL